MTYNDYWYGDPMLTRYYLEAYQLKKQRELSETNSKAWLQGYYNYIALVYASPSFNSLKPSKPIDYLSEPIPITTEEIEAKEEKERQERLRMLKEVFSKSAKKKERYEKCQETIQ